MYRQCTLTESITVRRTAFISSTVVSSKVYIFPNYRRTHGIYFPTYMVLSYTAFSYTAFSYTALFSTALTLLH